MKAPAVAQFLPILLIALLFFTGRIIALDPLLTPVVSAEPIAPGITYTRQLKGGGKHSFTTSALAGSCLRFVVVQRGIDVTVTIKDAAGNAVKTVDRPSGSRGRETVTFIVPETSDYEIEVAAWLTDAISGAYDISFAAAVSPDGNDRLRDTAETLTSRAEALRSGGDKTGRETAVGLFNESLLIWKKLGDPYEQAVTLYGIGFTELNLGRYTEAARYFNRALRIHTAAGDDYGMAVNLSALGKAQYSVNENEFAILNLHRAIGIYKKLGTPRGLGIAYLALGTAELQSGNTAAAIADLNQGVKWRELAEDPLGKARTHLMLAKIHLSLGHYAESRMQLKQAEVTLGPARAVKDADLALYSARLAIHGRNYRVAKSHLERALLLSQNSGDIVAESQILLEISRTDAFLGDPEKALEEIHKAVNLAELFRQTAPDQRARRNFFAAVLPYYDHYISLLMKMHAAHPEKGFDRRALEISEQARARVLIDRLERRRLIKEGKIPPELLENEQKLFDRVADLLPALKKGSQESKDEFQLAAGDLFELEAEIEELTAEPEQARLPTLGSDQMLHEVGGNNVLLEYTIAGEDIFLWYVAKDGIQSFRIPHARQVETTARAVYQCISKPPRAGAADLCRKGLSMLGNNLLGPVAGLLKDRRILVSKADELQYIPFTALIDPLTGDYLIKKNEVLQVPSLSAFSYIRSVNKPSETPKTLAAFGDPIFSPADPRLRQSGKLRQSAVAAHIEQYPPRLFASRFEVERIASLVDTDRRLVKTDAAASRKFVLDNGLGDYRLIHFATHTVIDDSHPLLSSVVLSNFDADGTPQDGNMRLNDVLRLDLRSDLVALSSCRSGIGMQVKGEGMVTLAHNFFAAGTRAVLVSLWNVDDKVTADLLSRFYKKHFIEHKTFSRALKEAKIDMISDPRWKAPYYWSAFGLQGVDVDMSGN